jgi:prepilin-type N-terminal cleavage/methylation domain-containing protein
MLRFLVPAAARNRRLGCEGQGVRQQTGRAPRSRARRGITLLELIVVLALLGLVLAIAAPAFIIPRAVGESDLATALGTARRAAVLRGEPVTVTIDAAGAWRVDGDATPNATPNATPIATGRLGSPLGRLRVRISPVGTCIPEPQDGVRLPNWNALGCGIAPRAEAARS